MAFPAMSPLTRQVFKSVFADIERTGGSSFLTEFGADTCDSVTHNSTECADVMELCTQHFQSWIHWPGDDRRTPRDLGLTRAYARAIAGTPLSASFTCTNQSREASSTLSASTRAGTPCMQWTYSLCYAIDTQIALPTEIWVDFDYYYPHGPAISSTDSLHVVRNGNVVTVSPTGPSAEGLTGCVTIA